MPDVEEEPDGRLPPDLPAGLPSGPPLYLWFDGILEGRRQGADIDTALRELVASINRLGLGRAELETDGGHFSMLMIDQTLTGDQVRQEQRDEFLRGLQGILDAVGPSGAVESTLRCTEVFADRTAESLFAPMGGEMRSVGRLRAVDASDRAHAPLTGSVIGGGLARIGRRNAMITLALVLVGGFLLAWNRGLVDQVFAVEGDQLAVELSSADQVLATELTSSWGNYVLTIQRGVKYPATTAARTTLLGEVTSTADLALLRAVVDGDEVFIRLEDEKNIVLSASPLKLRSLLTEATAKVVVKIPGRITAHHVRLALDPGRKRGGE